MYQQSIQFFWPLTEQIPLDLDYTDCDKPRLHYASANSVLSNAGICFTNGTTASTWVAMELRPPKLVVDVEDITFKQKVKPNLFRRLVYKIIGVQWELK